MPRPAAIATCIITLLITHHLAPAAPPNQTPLDLTAKLVPNAIDVSVGGKLFTAYKFAPDQKYPYLFPVSGPITGKTVTTETSQPYPHHHSLFFGCDKVNGGNYWQEGNPRGQITSKGPKILEAKGKRVVIEDHAQWHRPGAENPFSDKRTIVISAPSPTLRFIDFEITLTAEIDVQIVKTNHSLFCARMAPHMNVENGGRLVNAEGDLKQAGTLAKKSLWCDYSNKHDGHVEGLAILDWPKNRWTPCTWLTRDYGFFSPTPMNWLGPDGLKFKKGETLTLKYRVVVHAGNEKDADIAALYKQWTAHAGK
ncbi:MAG: PmoA family protein [Phycisphaerae bacterium]|nr:PmoA family protein [Phycisphaerae bacterium]